MLCDVRREQKQAMSSPPASAPRRSAVRGDVSLDGGSDSGNGATRGDIFD